MPRNNRGYPRRGTGRGRGAGSAWRGATGESSGWGSPEESDSPSLHSQLIQGPGGGGSVSETPPPPDPPSGGVHDGRGGLSDQRVRGALNTRGRGGRILTSDGQRSESSDIGAHIEDDTGNAPGASFQAGRAPAGTPLRPDFGTDGREIQLRTNFFPMQVPRGPLYDYHISMFPVAHICRLTKQVIALAEQSVEWRQAGMRGNVAHDSRSRLISAVRLPQPLTITVQNNEGGGAASHQSSTAHTYTLSINFVREMDTGIFASYLAGEAMHHHNDVLQIISALNIVTKSPSERLDVRIGRRFFSRATNSPLELGGGLEAWKGFCLAVRPVDKQLMVRISVCTTVFHTPGNLARAMIEFQQSSFGARFHKFCRNLRVRTTHLGHRKIVKKVASHTSRTHTIDTPEYGHVTVEDYFRQKYSLRLQYPDMPLVDVGGHTQCYLPAEVCDILQCQSFRGQLDERVSSMINTARQPPNANITAVVNKVCNQLVSDMTRPELQSFGITIGPDMAIVPGRILPRPTIKYSTTNVMIDERASWNLLGVKFAVGARLNNWVVLVVKDQSRDEFTDTSDEALHWAIARFCNMCHVSGMNVNTVPRYITAQLPRRDPSDPQREAAIETIRSALLSVNPKPSLIFVVLANGDKAVYEGLKHLCDVYLDVATICVQSSRIRQSTPHYLANTALKANMKLGGVNHKLAPESGEWLNNVSTMIVGISITHPSPGGATGTPSIAAVVASVDSDFAQYPASLKIQEVRKETVTNLTSMMVDRLTLFRKKNDGELPERIIVYRSGISESKIGLVRNEEVPQIIDAFKSLSSPNARYSPVLVIIICSKSHHVRFYPAEHDSAGVNGNCLPGTVVDRGVTAIYDFDFFLQCAHLIEIVLPAPDTLKAHGGMLGTTRPVHYQVVHDEIGFKANEIQGLTNSLSYMFARTTKAVRLASPACYARLACQRGRCYLRTLFHGCFGGDTPDGTQGGTEVFEEAQRVWAGGVSGAGLKDTMFYI